MRPFTVVLIKECLDGVRDRRSVLSALIFPVMAPFLVYFLIHTMIELRSQDKDLMVAVQGADHAPHLMAWLAEQGVEFSVAIGDPKALVSSQSEELVLVIPDNFAARIADAKTSYVELVSDSSRNDSRITVARVRSLVRGYNSELASLRLIVRGVSPDVMSVVSIVDSEVASQQEIATSVLSFIPIYIVLAAFISGMGIAVDSTAGERERKTFEALLINPVSRLQIVLGKWIAATLFSVLGMSLTLVLSMLVMSYMQLEALGLRFHVSALQVIAMLLATLPLAFLATSMQMLVGIFAKSFKDAQSYIGFLVLLPMLPGLYTMFNPIKTETWMYAVPMLGQHLLLTDVMGGVAVPVIGYFLSPLAVLLLCFVFSAITARLFKRESIIFS
jgi:sodium transport system permease protein|tara:strand:- start:8040 stop:9203 length:1164 start_codon:yes stop_codon:yes gene_type:complete